MTRRDALMSDERLDRLIVVALDDRADDIAAAALPATVIRERLEDRFAHQQRRFVLAVAMAVLVPAIVLTGAALAMTLGNRPPSPIPLPSSAATAPELWTGAIVNPCRFGLHAAVDVALGSHLYGVNSPEGMSGPRTVCRLYPGALDDSEPDEDPVGTIHAFEPSTPGLQRILGRPSGVEARATDGSIGYYFTHCSEGGCYDTLLVEHSELSVVIQLEDGVVEFDDLERVFQGMASEVVDILGGSPPSSPAAEASLPPIRIGLLEDACFFNFQVPVREVLDRRVVTEIQSPPGAPHGSVCQLYGNTAKDEYVGNIHVFEAPSAEELPNRVRTLVGEGDRIRTADASGTPIYMTSCNVTGCSNVVLIAHERYMVMVLLDDRVLEASTVFETLNAVGRGVAAKLDAPA